MRLDLIEYVALRVVRRFLFTDRFLARFGRWFPYYRMNANQSDAEAVVTLYQRHRSALGPAQATAPVILEIGSGATNAVGYCLARHGWAGSDGRIVLFEPYAPLDEAADQRARENLPSEVISRIERVDTLDHLAPACVDLVLSHSVLEHVRKPDELLVQLDRVLAPTGVMLHVVDYRDHLFKYPYHFLLFSSRVWNRFLDPGHLPRWRLGDQLRQFSSRGFDVAVLESESLPVEFERISGEISSGFDPADPHTAITKAVLVVRRM